MQAFLDPSGLKPFTKALTCLSKYGDDVTIYATPERLSLATTNSSKSAFAKFTYTKHFFTRYHVGITQAQNVLIDENEEAVTGQLPVKSLLLILKHRASDKTVERCELSLVEADSETREEVDSLDSKLIVRLYCRHGVTKTHRLIVSPPTAHVSPTPPDVGDESHLTIGPLALKDTISHFPATRGPKSDPQLMWNFSESEVRVSIFEASIDYRGTTQLNTEIMMSSDEFETYDIRSLPMSIAFHLREFNASIAYAESMSLALDLRFTDPYAPLFVDVEADDISTLFVISTTLTGPSARGNGHSGSRQSLAAGQKRPREQDTDGDAPAAPVPARPKRPMRAVQRVEYATPPPRTPRNSNSTRGPVSNIVEPPSSNPIMDPPSSNPMGPPPSNHMGPPSSNPLGPPSRSSILAGLPPSVPRRHMEPLFLPSSQLSVQEQQSMEDIGLAGVTNMEEVEQLFDDGGGDFTGSNAMEQDSVIPGESDDMVFAPTQDQTEKTFRPLFDD